MILLFTAHVMQLLTALGVSYQSQWQHYAARHFAQHCQRLAQFTKLSARPVSQRANIDVHVCALRVIPPRNFTLPEACAVPSDLGCTNSAASIDIRSNFRHFENTSGGFLAGSLHNRLFTILHK